MSIKRIQRLYFVECDECGEPCNEDGGNYQEAVDAFKMEGGRVYKDEDGEWAHACRSCRTR